MKLNKFWRGLAIGLVSVLTASSGFLLADSEILWAAIEMLICIFILGIAVTNDTHLFKGMALLFVSGIALATSISRSSSTDTAAWTTLIFLFLFFTGAQGVWSAIWRETE